MRVDQLLSSTLSATCYDQAEAFASDVLAGLEARDEVHIPREAIESRN
jgi:hypothetical protein